MIKEKGVIIMRYNTKKVFFTMFIAMLFFSTPHAVYAQEGMGSVFWDKNGQGWVYHKPDDSLVINEWKQVWDNWYYFGDDGVSKQNTWAEIDGKWYYFDSFSVMLHDTTTPDGHTVGSDGAWITE